MFVGYEKQVRRYKRRVFFQGTGALVKGQGVCYNKLWADTGTGELATDAHGYRDKYVNLPSNTLNRWFAGVTVQAYAAKATGQWIEIYEPGSVCMVSIGRDTTIGTTFLTCSAATADAGRFIDAGFMGRGTAQIIQTKASGNLGQSLDGTAAVSGTTLTKTALFTDAVVGDKVIIYGGTNSVPVPAEYTIATRTSADEVELSSAPGNGDVCCYVISGTTPPEALAYLCDGEESGLVEWIDCANGAVSVMVGGVTEVCGGYDLSTGDATFALADAIQPGLKKAFKLRGALGMNDLLITPDTAGVQLDGSTALNSLELDGDGDRSVLEWKYGIWKLVENNGTALT